ncbi:MAG: type IV pili twitching motility protein PilT, partial [Armatimonadota bacterium]
MNSIHSLLEQAINNNASDLLIAAGSKPTLRVDGRLVITDSKPFTRVDAEEAIDAIIDSSIRDYLIE